MTIPELDAFLATRRQTLGLVQGLSQKQVDYRPNPRVWSVGEVLDHLIRVDRIFRRDFQEIFERAGTGSACLVRTLSDFDVSLPFVPDALVPLFDLPLAFLGAVVPRPVRQIVAKNRAVPLPAFKAIRPIHGGSIRDLYQELESMAHFTEALVARYPETRLDRLFYYNPLTSGTTFLGLLSFIASHETRHQDQIRDILAGRGSHLSTT